MSSLTKVRTSLFGSSSPSKVHSLVKHVKEEIELADEKDCLVNTHALTKGVQKCLSCRYCNSSNIEVKERFSIGVSSVLEIICHKCYKQTNSRVPDPYKVKEDVKYPVIVEPKLATEFHDGDQDKYRFLDFEANIKALISVFHVGCGPHEVGLLLSNLNIHKAKSLEASYYRHIHKLDVHLREAAKYFVKGALDDEVMGTYEKELKEQGATDETKKRKIEDAKQNGLTETVGLDVAYDMGWQKRSSGKRYDSKSGHAFLIGLTTNKIIGVVVFCKECRICNEARKKGIPPPIHPNCPKNYEGSTKAMESDGAMKLILEIFDANVS